MPVLIGDATLADIGWHAHPDVWLVVLLLGGGYVYALRRIAPYAAPAGRPAASRGQKLSFLAGLLAILVVSDWPVHDVGEQSLFAVHTVEHIVLALVAPPLLLIGTPRWLASALVPGSWIPVLRQLTRPLPAFLLFNGVILALHWPALVDLMIRSSVVHFVAHAGAFLAALVMWMPVLSPHPELKRISPPLQMLYLFGQSLLPTIPASFITFASVPVYQIYVEAPRLWGVSALTDQLIAGLIMKILGGLILWVAITIVFFRWWAEEQRWERIERELRHPT